MNRPLLAVLAADLALIVALAYWLGLAWAFLLLSLSALFVADVLLRDDADVRGLR